MTKRNVYKNQEDVYKKLENDGYGKLINILKKTKQILKLPKEKIIQMDIKLEDIENSPIIFDDNEKTPLFLIDVLFFKELNFNFKEDIFSCFLLILKNKLKIKEHNLKNKIIKYLKEDHQKITVNIFSDRNKSGLIDNKISIENEWIGNIDLNKHQIPKYFFNQYISIYDKHYMKILDLTILYYNIKIHFFDDYYKYYLNNKLLNNTKNNQYKYIEFNFYDKYNVINELKIISKIKHNIPLYKPQFQKIEEKLIKVNKKILEKDDLLLNLKSIKQGLTKRYKYDFEQQTGILLKTKGEDNNILEQIDLFWFIDRWGWEETLLKHFYNFHGSKKPGLSFIKTVVYLKEDIEKNIKAFKKLEKENNSNFSSQYKSDILILKKMGSKPFYIDNNIIYVSENNMDIFKKAIIKYLKKLYGQKPQYSLNININI